MSFFHSKLRPPPMYMIHVGREWIECNHQGVHRLGRVVVEEEWIWELLVERLWGVIECDSSESWMVIKFGVYFNHSILSCHVYFRVISLAFFLFIFYVILLHSPVFSLTHASPSRIKCSNIRLLSILRNFSNGSRALWELS